MVWWPTLLDAFFCSWNLRSADLEGFTALHLAASSGSASMCALLLNLNAPMDVRNQQGRTALGEDDGWNLWKLKLKGSTFTHLMCEKKKYFNVQPMGGFSTDRDKRKDTDVARHTTEQTCGDIGQERPYASGLKMDICGETICFRRLCNWRGPLGSCRAAWCEKAAARVFHFHFFDGFFSPKANQTSILQQCTCISSAVLSLSPGNKFVFKGRRGRTDYHNLSQILQGNHKHFFFMTCQLLCSRIGFPSYPSNFYSNPFYKKRQGSTLLRTYLIHVCEILSAHFQIHAVRWAVMKHPQWQVSYRFINDQALMDFSAKFWKKWG